MHIPRTTLRRIDEPSFFSPFLYRDEAFVTSSFAFLDEEILQN